MKYTIDNHIHVYPKFQEDPCCDICGLLKSTIEKHRSQPVKPLPVNQNKQSELGSKILEIVKTFRIVPSKYHYEQNPHLTRWEDILTDKILQSISTAIQEKLPKENKLDLIGNKSQQDQAWGINYGRSKVIKEFLTSLSDLGLEIKK